MKKYTYKCYSVTEKGNYTEQIVKTLKAANEYKEVIANRKYTLDGNDIKEYGYELLIFGKGA